MNVLDWILVVIRWSHALAAVAWVGGGMFYIMVLRPAMRRAKDGDAETSRAIGEEFRGLVNTAIAVLLLTGVILSVSRLTDNAVTIAYVAVLAAKVALALYMFYVVRFARPRVYPGDSDAGSGWLARTRTKLTNTTSLLIFGVVVFGLSDVLDALFERGLGG